MDDLRDLPIDLIVEPWILLRPVNKNSVEYLEMMDSIEKNGFLSSIAVRECPRQEGFWEIIDGMYRWTCSKELGRVTVPAIIKTGVTDEDVLALQIQANAIRPETKPCEFACQLKRIQKVHQGITIAALAMMVSKSPNWISKQLGLLKLDQVHQMMVDRGEICLQNAYMLAKLPARFRVGYEDRAKTMKAPAFGALAAGVLKQYQEAKRQGKLDAFFTEDFQPQPHLRSLKVIQDEYQIPLEGPIVRAAEDCRTPRDGWNAAFKWMMHLDYKSVKEQEHAAKARFRVKRFA